MFRVTFLLVFLIPSSCFADELPISKFYPKFNSWFSQVVLKDSPFSEDDVDRYYEYMYVQIDVWALIMMACGCGNKAYKLAAV